MFFFLSKILDVFLSPLTWGILLCLVGLWRKWRWLRWAPALAAAELVLFSLDPVSNALLTHLEQQARRSVRRDVTYDAILLLGGPVNHGSTASHDAASYNENVERLLVSYDLLRAGRAKNVIVSGGYAWSGDRVNEARVLGRQLEDWGIAHDRVVLEPRARNTHENAVESKRLVKQRGYRTLLLVTSAYHMPRALDCFRAVGVDVDALPVDFRASDSEGARDWLPRASHLETSESVLREMFGRWVYRVRGYGKGE
ncbi:MAG: YdcF family protein [Polyangiaceae bacterium]|nr:YdcF family protein [Polyangiaceae bacterium]